MNRGVEVRIAGYEGLLRFGRTPAARRAGHGAPHLELARARQLERRFPALRALGLPLSEETADPVLAFYHEYLPLVHEPARGAHTRTLLHRLRAASGDPALGEAATRAIAESVLDEGVPDRARVLENDPHRRQDWLCDVEAFELAYGAPLVRGHWRGSRRGDALRLYFEGNPELLRGREVLHWAPEAELRAWLAPRGEALGWKRYVTMDGFHPEVDALHDITDIRVPDGSFDLVLCHRVLEHVLDDAKALSELFRLLRPGGLLHFSVPQSPHRKETAEWVVPDESYDEHVRQYGDDLAERVRKAGFASVELDPWLLEQPEARLREAGAYPMRIYLARR